MIALLLLLDVVAAHRLIRLATKDTITQPLRERLIAWTYREHFADEDPPQPAVPTHPTMWQEWAEDDGEAPKLATLITCRWCAGVWIAAGVTAARWTIPTVWTVIAYALAVASLGVLLARAEAED